MVLMVAVAKIDSASLPSSAECAIDYLNFHESSNETTKFNHVCSEIISSEVEKFYDEFQNLSEILTNRDCINENLRHFNVSDVFLKGMAHQELNKAYSLNTKMLSQRIILAYAKQLCNPHQYQAEIVSTLNMRTTQEQANCLLNHLNENSVHTGYQFKDDAELMNHLDALRCGVIINGFVQLYYNILDTSRSFSIFGLNPLKVVQCRRGKDKALINNMMFWTIFPRLQLSPEQKSVEEIRYYDVARETSLNFFECISLYD